MSKNVEMVAGDLAENVCRGQESLTQTKSGKSLIGILVRRYGNDLEGDALSSATSYIAPLRVERLKKNSVMDYEYYLIIGSLDIIRKKVYEIRENKW